MNLIDDHPAHILKIRQRGRVGEHDRQAFRRGREDGRRIGQQLAAQARAGVPRPRADPNGEFGRQEWSDAADGPAQVFANIAGQGF